MIQAVVLGSNESPADSDPSCLVLIFQVPYESYSMGIPRVYRDAAERGHND